MKKILAAITLGWMGALTLQAAESVLLDWGPVDTASAVRQSQSRQLRAAAAPATVQQKSAAGTIPWLVQFREVVREDWKNALEQEGAVLRGYIPENAFLVEASPEVMARIGARKEVFWIGEYRPEYKRARAVRTALARGMEGTREMSVVLFNPADAGRIAEAIAALDGCAVRLVGSLTDRGLVRAALTASAVEQVTGWGEVEWVEPYLPPRLLNDVALSTAKMNVSNAWSVLGLSGTNQIIAVCDTGLDSGNTNTIHQDFFGRVAWAQGLGRVGIWSDTNGHGTHVAGSILGSGALSSGRYRGGSYAARIVFQSVLDSGGGLGGLPADLNVLYRAAFTNGARIHSDSWGSADAGSYTTESRATDMFIWSNKTMLVLFAAGNEGIDANSDGIVDLGSVDSPGTAKNCLTIGAAESYRTTGGYSTYTWYGAWPDDYPADPVKSDYLSRPDSPQGMAAFSSRGPCLDGRIKPELVAPGTDIISTRSRATGDTGWGNVSGNTNYIYMGGTSMATPLTAGAAGLVRQWLTTSGGLTNPSAALIKALMINGSRDMAPGQYGTNATQEIPFTRPNNVAGWGHVNLYGTLTLATGQFLQLYDTNTLATGATNTFTLAVGSATTNRFALTMAYSDYWAASGSGKKLINDLDLTVRKPSGTILYANGRSGLDATNNVEHLEFAPDEAGTYSVRVAGRTVPSGGSQAYALVIRGYDAGVTDSLAIFPAGGFSAAGPQGGPFAPASAVYTLTNSGASALSWSGSRGAGLTWLDLARTNGTLAAGAASAVTVTVNAAAGALATGVYSGTVTFSNLTTGTAQTRTAELTVRPMSQFLWNNIATTQQQGAAFAVTLTAADTAGATVTAFQGTATLTGVVAAVSTNGTGTNGWVFPMSTYYHDARTQVIYLQSELGAAATLAGLALNVAVTPGQALGNWTIRMKHTASSVHSPAAWEGPASGWTTVYQGDTTVSSTGWVWFTFSTPFAYNGVSNLMVDFSFNNTSYTTDGQVRSSTGAVGRTLAARYDSTYGDPLDWSGTSSPTPIATNLIPNVLWSLGNTAPVTPSVTGAFTNGVWSGLVTIDAPAASMALRATSTNGATGNSNPFEVKANSALPSVTTIAASNITPTTAEGGGTVTADGGATVSLRGVCWSTNAAPNTNDVKTGNGSGTGAFASTLTNLTPGRLYYARAYAVNSNGAGYGSAVNFTAACFTNAPNSVRASATNVTSFTAAWNTLAGASGYRLDVSAAAGFGGGAGATLIDEDFVSFADWTDDGTASDVDPTHYGLASPCRALSSNDTLTTPAVDYPTQLVFHLDSSSAGNNKVTTNYYSLDGGASWLPLSTFTVTTASATNTCALTAAPDLSGSTSVKFRFVSSFNTWYLDDVQVTGGNAGDYVPGYADRPVAGTSQAVTGLTAATTYYFRLRAVSDGGCVSGNSATQSVTTGGGSLTLTATAGANGRIEPAGAIPVSPGSNPSFTVASSNHYRIADITTNAASIGVPFGNGNTNHVFVWSNVTQNGAIDATFTAVVTTNSPAPVSEAWLAQYYPGSNNYESVAIGDTDGDGLLAWEEYIAGTDPTQTNSTLNAGITEAFNPARHLITWWGSPLPNRRYGVYWATNLQMTPVPLAQATNLPSAYPNKNVATNNSPPANPSVFYRIRVRLEE